MPTAPENALRPSEVLAKNIRRLRHKRDWSQQVLADRLGKVGLHGWDRSTIAKIESGTRGVSIDEAMAMAFVLGVRPAALLFPKSEDERVRIAPGYTTSSALAHWWTAGVLPLSDNPDAPLPAVGDPPSPAVRLYREECHDYQAWMDSYLPGLDAAARNVIGILLSEQLIATGEFDDVPSPTRPGTSATHAWNLDVREELISNLKTLRDHITGLLRVERNHYEIAKKREGKSS